MTEQRGKNRIKYFFILIAAFSMVSCKTNNEKEGSQNDRTWSVYKADEESSSYSPLDQINTSNVTQLKPSWEYTFKDLPQSAQPANSQSNPIIVDGVMYSLSAKRVAYAVNAATGKEIWKFDPFEAGGGGGVERGVTYWEEGDDKRIFFAADNYLVALDARTGKPIAEFGENGKINLNVGLRRNPEDIAVTMTSRG